MYAVILFLATLTLNLLSGYDKIGIYELNLAVLTFQQSDNATVVSSTDFEQDIGGVMGPGSFLCIAASFGVSLIGAWKCCP